MKTSQIRPHNMANNMMLFQCFWPYGKEVNKNLIIKGFVFYFHEVMKKIQQPLSLFG
jgi:hypothetical protein